MYYWKVKFAHRWKNIQIWAEDEARIGLQAITRRVWSLKWVRPLAHHKTRYDWEYVYGFVQPSTGESEFFFLPSVSNELMSIAMDEFVKARKLKENNTVVILLIDQAWFHSLKRLKIPEEIVLFPLPPYSPQLQPVECAWPLLHEPIANKNFTSMNSLEETLSTRAKYLMDNPNILKWAVGFNWICRISN